MSMDLFMYVFSIVISILLCIWVIILKIDHLRQTYWHKKHMKWVKKNKKTWIKWKKELEERR